jgi:hypothetical protein
MTRVRLRLNAKSGVRYWRPAPTAVNDHGPRRDEPRVQALNAIGDAPVEAGDLSRELHLRDPTRTTSQLPLSLQSGVPMGVLTEALRGREVLRSAPELPFAVVDAQLVKAVRGDFTSHAPPVRVDTSSPVGLRVRRT